MARHRIPEDQRFAAVIVDEAHYVKNPDAKRTKNTRTLLNRSDRVVLMSGTPLENRVEEFRVLVDHIRPDLTVDAEHDPMAFRKQIRTRVPAPESGGRPDGAPRPRRGRRVDRPDPGRSLPVRRCGRQRQLPRDATARDARRRRLEQGRVAPGGRRRCPRERSQDARVLALPRGPRGGTPGGRGARCSVRSAARRRRRPARRWSTRSPPRRRGRSWSPRSSPAEWDSTSRRPRSS